MTPPEFRLGVNLLRATAIVDRHSQVGLRILLVAIPMFTLGCDQKSTKAPDLTAGEWLDLCTPFESFDAARMLTFQEKDHSVKLAEAVGDERAQGALMARNPVVTQGTWQLDETTKIVTIDLGAGKTSYKLVMPANASECILVAGEIDSANLRQSWFGTADFTEEPEE